MIHPDRLLPSDPDVRGLARSIYETTRSLPIVSPHGHVVVDIDGLDAEQVAAAVLDLYARR